MLFHLLTITDLDAIKMTYCDSKLDSKKAYIPILGSASSGHNFVIRVISDINQNTVIQRLIRFSLSKYKKNCALLSALPQLCPDVLNVFLKVCSKVSRRIFSNSQKFFLP